MLAYQLAVVVDDDAAGITDVVRGADLLDSTAWQIGASAGPGLPTPRYVHLPLVTEPDGAKLSKSRACRAAGRLDRPRLLDRVLALLRQEPPASLQGGSLAESVAMGGGSHWAVHRLVGLTSSLRLPELR